VVVDAHAGDDVALGHGGTRATTDKECNSH
jgi:hypothetical protein